MIKVKNYALMVVQTTLLINAMNIEAINKIHLKTMKVIIYIIKIQIEILKNVLEPVLILVKNIILNQKQNKKSVYLSAVTTINIIIQANRIA